MHMLTCMLNTSIDILKEFLFLPENSKRSLRELACFVARNGGKWLSLQLHNYALRIPFYEPELQSGVLQIQQNLKPKIKPAKLPTKMPYEPLQDLVQIHEICANMQLTFRPPSCVISGSGKIRMDWKRVSKQQDLSQSYRY